MTATTRDPHVFDLAYRLIKTLGAIHHETAQWNATGQDLHVTSEVSILSYDALAACQRLRQWAGQELAVPDNEAAGNRDDLESLAQEFLDLVAAGPGTELELVLVSIGRVVNGMARYAELT
ncbi:hypothetical protein [Aeromicrobium sp. Leaf350]|uniref:hypothetical protein n=1 Tax=Aeromicrobium sp. Leaf350 TaxID=2876565 RepID=UPI001E4989B3|nr:hypothetical protein [Aeromicrobium sp. Leaf350]